MTVKFVGFWEIHWDEISNNVYQVNAFDIHGRNVSTTHTDYDAALDDVLLWIFNLEKGLKLNFNHFLYELCLLKLEGKAITLQQYDHDHFGSWVIQIGRDRLMYWGREQWLLFQTNDRDQWVDSCIVKYEEIDFAGLLRLLTQLEHH